MRFFTEKIFKALMIISLIIVAASLLGIIGVIIIKGSGAMNLDMITKTSNGGYYLGGEGGLLNAILGSLLLGLGGLIIASIVGLPVALALQKEYHKGLLVRVTRVVLDVLWGVPSIVYGAFGFIIMQLLGLRASLLAGIIVLALLMFPIMTRAAEEVIRLVPGELKEASYSLGANKNKVMKLVLKKSLPGIITAMLLALGRGIGDAASILFTTGYTDHLPSGLLEPVASLPLAIFFQINSPLKDVQARAYAAALILLVIVLIISLLTRFLARKNERFVKRC